MKIENKLLLLLVAFLSLGITGCSDDDEPVIENIPKLELGQEMVKIKIGEENKQTLDIKQGGGEYDAFSLNNDIVTVKLEGNNVILRGISNGTSSIIVSDKNGYYRKLPVTVYTTDKITLSADKLDIVSILGHAKQITATVELGNGGYQGSSDNPAVQVSVSEEGEIKITCTSKQDEIKALVTITDNTGLSASINVTVISTLIPYTNEELNEIKTNNSVRYYLEGENSISYTVKYYNSVDKDGKQLYGWDFYGFFYFRLLFSGGKSEGKKSDATLSCNFDNMEKYFTYEDESIDLEIIKNDGTHLWGIYSFVKDEVLHFGYFCDKI